MTLDAIQGIPKTQRYIVYVIIFVAVLGLFFVYPFRTNHKKLQTLNKNVKELERQIIVNKSLAEKKDELLAKNAELQQRLLEVQQKFPTSSEVTDLLKQLSVLGQQSGLDIQLWKPGNKVKNPSNLYYEIPVQIEVTGVYHDVGTFFDKVSKLSRIVNITDLAMSSRNKDLDIMTKCVAKTFSAMGPEEIQAAQQESKEAKSAATQGKKRKH
jgi:type IV pilus assembly protein PilO